jgi:hypothetical protein
VPPASGGRVVEIDMSPCFPESNISQTLSDPLIRSVMAADRVDPRELERHLNAIARTIAKRRGEPQRRSA